MSKNIDGVDFSSTVFATTKQSIHVFFVTKNSYKKRKSVVYGLSLVRSLAEKLMFYHNFLSMLFRNVIKSSEKIHVKYRIQNLSLFARL